MASTFTGQHSLEKPGAGEQRGVWNLSLNTNFDKIDAALSRVVTFSEAEMNTNPDIASSQSAVATFDAATYFFSGTLAATRTVTFPSSKQGSWVVDISNVTFANNNLVFKVDGETNGVTITSISDPAVIVYSDGTSMKRVGDDFNPYILDEIRMWAPRNGFTSSAQLPDGWHVCNGTNGTPDLRNKFVRGSSNHVNYSTETKTGGAATTSISLGSFAVVGITESTAITESQMPQHRHFTAVPGIADNTLTSLNAITVQRTENSPGRAAYFLKAGTSEPTVGLTSQTGGGQGHTHNVSIALNDGAASLDTIPPHYIIIYIQYTGD